MRDEPTDEERRGVEEFVRTSLHAKDDEPFVGRWVEDGVSMSYTAALLVPVWPNPNDPNPPRLIIGTMSLDHYRRLGSGRSEGLSIQQMHLNADEIRLVLPFMVKAVGPIDAIGTLDNLV